MLTGLGMKEIVMSTAGPAKIKRRPPEVVFRDGKPAAVILDIEEYQEMLERLDDVEDLKMLSEMRSQPLKFRRVEEFLAEYDPSV